MFVDNNSKRIVKLGNKLFVWFLSIAAIAAIAVGQAEPSVGQQLDIQNLYAVDTEAQVTSNVVPSEELIEEEQPMEGLVKDIQSLNFKKGMTIKDALHFLGARYKKNIVPSLKVDGIVTVTSLYDVTFQQALEAILGYGFKYEQDGNFIKVYTAEEYKTIKEDKDRMIHKSFTLYYISAAEAAKLIKPVLSGSAFVQASTSAATGVPTADSISSNQGDGGDNLATNDMLVIYDYPENLKKAEELLCSVDIRPKQVLIEAAILSVTLTEDTQFGVDWQTLKGSAVTGLASITAGAPDYLKSAGTSQVDKTGGFTIGFALGDIGSFIRAVEEITDITVMAKPKILAVNKQLGQVYIGQKLGYREGDIITDGGATQEGAVKFLDTGTKLSFRPYIANDGYIRMDIHPKDSTGSLNAQGIPDETSAELVSNIMVKDGQTVVIGGMFRDKITTKRTQVPVLGDIPVLGGAFRGTADKVERQEVVVLLTPHILEEPSEAEGQARADDINRARYGAKDQIQWIARMRLAEDSYAKASEYYLEGNLQQALEELHYTLEIYPTYLEAIRLKEKIMLELSDGDTNQIERLMLEDLEKQDTEYWDRRIAK